MLAAFAPSLISLLAVVAFFAVWLLLWLPIAVPLAARLRWQPGQPLSVAQKLPLLASLYLIAPLIVWGAAALTGASFADYGWSSQGLRSAAWGWVGGAGGLGLMMAIELGCGWVSWQSPFAKQPWHELGKAAAFPLVLGVWVGGVEELVFRGFVLTQLQTGCALWAAAALSSLIFALLHLVWEGRENLPQLPGLWLMGMVLALARWVDGGSLGLAWGLHAGWIWAIATLDAAAAIGYPQSQLAWLTGLGGKPLAGLMGLLFLLVTGGVLWRLQVGGFV